MQDNILLAEELFMSLKRKVRGANIALKLVMEKAYDKLYWFALIKVMRKFGFFE